MLGAMASHYLNTTTEGYEDSRNDSNMTSSLLKTECHFFNFILYIVVCGPLCIVGFIANIICYNVLKVDSGKKHRAATFLLQALAVADNLVLTTFPAFSIVIGLLPMFGKRGEIWSSVAYGHVYVYVGPFLNMAVTVTVWITVLIAINRYIAVCRPLDAHRLASLKKTRVQVAVVFTMALIFKLPTFFKYTIVYQYDYISVPSLKETRIGPSTLFGIVYDILCVTVSVLILPLILLVIFNTRIMWELRKVDKWKEAIRQNDCRPENNITVVMVVIIIVFIVCNIPSHIHVVASHFIQNDSCSGWELFSRVSHVLMIANSSTNFVVYYVLRKSFRRAFRKALSCC